MTPLLQLKGIHRRFGDRVALDDVSLALDSGELVGLVGPNGSGKTTLLKIVAGFLRPNAGEARVFGIDPFREQARIMERARFAFAPPALFASLTAREHLVHLSRIRPRGAAPVTAALIDDVLDTVGLASRADDRVSAYSFGMRQRLALAQAMVPRPELLVLDEPTDGLDPLAILELRGVLKELRERHAVAILLSSHLLVEIEHLVDRMLVLSEGSTLFSGPPEGLTAGGERLLLGVTDPVRAVRALAERGIEALADESAVLLAPDALDLRAATELLASAGLTLESFHVRRPTLEDALLERLREANRRSREGSRR